MIFGVMGDLVILQTECWIFFLGWNTSEVIWGDELLLGMKIDAENQWMDFEWVQSLINSALFELAVMWFYAPEMGSLKHINWNWKVGDVEIHQIFHVDS